MPDDQPSRSSVRLVWVGVPDEEIVFANQLMVQHIGSEFIVTFGQVTPPVLLGTDEEKREALGEIELLPIKPVARVGLTAQRMAEFVQVMQDNLSGYERQRALEEGRGAE